MDMTITDRAYEWFKEEMNLAEGDHVQFFVRYGGDANFQTGFSLALGVKEPDEPAVQAEKGGIIFYIEQKDIWYFDNEDFKVEYDEDIGEIRYVHGE